MIDPEDFIEGFLIHAQSKAQVSAYNREYYKKNKHKWKDRSGPVFQQGKGVVRPRSQSEARVIAAEKKIARARAAAKKLPPKKRNAVLRQLISAQKKLNKLKKKAFKTKTKVTVRTAKDFPKAFPKKKSTTKITVRTAKDFPKAFPKKKTSTRRSYVR